MNEKIFVSIAAYEEPDLIKTIKNCLKTANNPENIIFGISLQYKNEPDLSFLKNSSRIIRFNNNIRKLGSPGIIEIRSAIRKLCDNEDYFLQIDSHTTFIDEWDSNLIRDIEELNINKKTIISKQIQEIENISESYTIWEIYKDSLSDFLVGSIKEDTENIIINRLVNDKYFINYYVSGNFIFSKMEWVKTMQFPDYHKIPYEEQELSLVTFCNDYQVVAPRRTNQYIFAGNDSKYTMPRNPEYWDFVGSDKNNPRHWKRFWSADNETMIKEVRKLLITGFNKYMNINELPNKLVDFYKNINLYKEYQEAYLSFYPESDTINIVSDIQNIKR